MELIFELLELFQILPQRAARSFCNELLSSGSGCEKFLAHVADTVLSIILLNLANAVCDDLNSDDDDDDGIVVIVVVACSNCCFCSFC